MMFSALSLNEEQSSISLHCRLSRALPARRQDAPAGRTYRVIIDVPHYEQRRVEVLFSKDNPKVAKITADGSTDSPHRYEKDRLCIWYPKDPDEEKWVFADSFLVLIGMIAIHLFKEAWWRETGEWLGPEAGHPEQPSLEGASAT